MAGEQPGPGRGEERGGPRPRGESVEAKGIGGGGEQRRGFVADGRDEGKVAAAVGEESAGERWRGNRRQAVERERARGGGEEVGDGGRRGRERGEVETVGMEAEDFGDGGIERGEPIEGQGTCLADEEPGDRRGEGFGRPRPGHECRQRYRAGVLIEGACRVVGDQPGAVENEWPVVPSEGGCDLWGHRRQPGEVDGAGKPGQLGRLVRGKAVEGVAIELRRRRWRERGRRSTEIGDHGAAADPRQRRSCHGRPDGAPDLAAGSGTGSGGGHGSDSGGAPGIGGKASTEPPLCRRARGGNSGRDSHRSRAGPLAPGRRRGTIRTRPRDP